MQVQNKSNFDYENLVLCSTREVLKETMAADEEEYYRDKWTMFGNEAEKVEIGKASAHMKYLEDLSQKAPDFPVPLRAHTVWEGMTVKLSFPPLLLQLFSLFFFLFLLIRLFIHIFSPSPSSPLFPSSSSTVIIVSTSSNTTSLPIFSCFSTIFPPLPSSSPFPPLLLAMTTDTATSPLALVLEQEAQFGSTFPPTWVREGESLVLKCGFTSAPLPFQQEVSWFRDGVQLHHSSRVDIKTASEMASITLRGIHKEDEGVYSVRLRTWDGVQEHSAFVYVKDASAAVVGGPASPLAVQVHDVNKDYVFLTWKPPSADGATPVEGYFGQWVRCNDQVQKMCHYPVFGLKEGTMYQFRVRSVNQAGEGRPSKATEPVLTADPLEHTRTMVDEWREIIITKDQLEGQIKVPFPPTDVHACEVSDTYVVLSWTEPEPRGREPLTFYVEQSLTGKNSWRLANMDKVVNSPRFPVFDLEKGKEYCFRVRSVNKYGVSDPSEPSMPISLGKTQAAPASPHSVQPFRDTDTSVLLQWQEPKEKDDILGYYLYYSEAGKQNWQTINNKPVTKTRFTVHGLKTQREYVFRVKSVSRAGNSKYSDESSSILVKSAIHVPSPPSAIALLLCSGSEMVLTWRAPAWNGGDPVRGYYLDQRDKSVAMWREVNVKPVKERQFKVCNLADGHYYQFRVFAANLAGIGKPSEPSEAFLCEKWTMPQPGCPYDLEFREVRHDSLVLLWEAPLYEGQSPVTGYMVEISQGDQSESWTPLNDKPIPDTLYRVPGLQDGQTYRFRVSAVNEAGVGRASLTSEPITAETQPGTKNIEIGVDNDGFIFLAYEAAQMTDSGEFLWSKNYRDAIDAARARVESKQNRSVLTFSDPTEEDLGLYTAEMSDNPNQSSSYNFTAEGKLKPLVLGISLKSGWQVDISEKGEVRLWLQTESLSKDAELRLIFNDREISSTPHRKINFDKAKGLVEILFDQLSQEDEGSYTAQLRDGRAKNQFTLVFVDESEQLIICSLSQGPYFLEFLSWIVTEDCELVIKCKVLALSAGPLRIQCTPEGFKLYCSLKYYLIHIQRIDARNKPGSSMQKVWIEIFNPTENDKGKYTVELFDGKDTHQRHLDLSGQAFSDALLEYQRLNFNPDVIVSDRAKVTKGLPDVVAIMEGKSLCLTCFIDGDPAPEIFWLRNDRELISQNQFSITKEPKCSTLTVTNVTMEDSGKYSIFVRNKYGSQTVNVTVGVFDHPENELNTIKI
uniref:Myomesin 3 n=1 Tax=Myripristis murdjan TaxID=586833 RepID=A0A667ZIA8_9TELE